MDAKTIESDKDKITPEVTELETEAVVTQEPLEVKATNEIIYDVPMELIIHARTSMRTS